MPLIIIISGSVEQLNVLIWGVRNMGVWGITLFKVIIRT